MFRSGGTHRSTAFLFAQTHGQQQCRRVLHDYVMLPFFLLAMYERHGQPLEVVAGQIIRCMFLRTKERPYQTNNFYAALERQAQAEKEVKAIVQKAKARAAGTAGGKTHGKANRCGKA